MESGIRTQKSLESGIQELGIRNPETRNPESGTWNPESTIRLDFLTWGEMPSIYSQNLTIVWTHKHHWKSIVKDHRKPDISNIRKCKENNHKLRCWSTCDICNKAMLVHSVLHRRLFSAFFSAFLKWASCFGITSRIWRHDWDPRVLGQEESKGILKKEKIEWPTEKASGFSAKEQSWSQASHPPFQ